uniref:Sodium/potassium-transporting ATPase subunit beta n=1 Tax=Salarias fasciatus TaxID=181472 RepID=A0A672GME4_SALFA
MSSSAPTQNQEPGQEPDREPGQEPDREPDQKPEQDPGDKKDAAQEEKTEEVKEEKKEVKEVKEPAMGFIYNRRTGEFLGRTASSWGLILLFYLVFYGFLAAMFLLTMWVMLLTLDDNVPKHQDRVPSPGLVIRPHAAEISFNRSNPADYSGYVQQLHQFLQPYEDSRQEQNELCLVGEYTLQDGEPLKKACQFKRSLLRYCSGLSDTSFGYSDGKPCVLIKMNRIIGLKPIGDPYVNCTSKGNAPLEMLYFPSDGRIDKMFFPYYGKKAHPDYVQPLVAVKLLLTKEDYNVEQTVECKLEGSDLRNNDDRDKSLGRVIFRVKVFQ